MKQKGWLPPKKVSEYLEVNEVLRIIEAVPKERDKLILRTLWETGGRISEVLSLTKNNIITGDNCILLYNLKQSKRKKLLDGTWPPKAPKRLKRIFLSENSTLMKDLIAFCEKSNVEPDDLVFSGGCRHPDRKGQVSPSYIWKLLSEPYDPLKGKKGGIAWHLNIRRIKKDKGSEIDTGQEKNKPAWPHIFRHSAAMELLKRTGRLDVVKEQLGHSTILTTEEYAGLTDRDRKKIVGESKFGNKDGDAL